MTDPESVQPSEDRLIDAALRYYGDTMPGYAAAAGLSREEYAAVMVDVRAARKLRDQLAARAEAPRADAELRTVANAHPNTDGTPWGWVADRRGREVAGLRWSRQRERDLIDAVLRAALARPSSAPRADAEGLRGPTPPPDIEEVAYSPWYRATCTTPGAAIADWAGFSGSAEDAVTVEAIAHVLDTGHEAAVERVSSIHYRRAALTEHPSQPAPEAES